MTRKDIEQLLAGKFDLDIPNFERWNPPLKMRNGKENPDQRRDWLKLSVDWFFDQKMHGATPTQLLLWVKLMCVRAASGKRLASVTIAWIQRRAGVQASSVKRDILKLSELLLVELSPTMLEEKRVEESTSHDVVEGDSSIVEELRGVEDDCLKKVPLPAQRSWLKEFGRDVITQILPTAFASWKMDQPRSSKTNQVVPLAMYLRRCFEVQKNSPRTATQNLRETNWDYVFGRAPQ